MLEQRRRTQFLRGNAKSRSRFPLLSRTGSRDFLIIRVGTVRAESPGRMGGARHYSQLRVWKLADALRAEVFELTARPKFARDFKAQEQADDAINSVCRNIAEGFGCGTHAEFANFLVYSRRSLNEVRDAIRGARMKRYVNADDLQRVSDLVHRLHPALSRFIAYLRRTPDPTRKNGQQKPRFDKRLQTRTIKRQSDRTDPRQQNRTDPKA